MARRLAMNRRLSLSVFLWIATFVLSAFPSLFAANGGGGYGGGHEGGHVGGHSSGGSSFGHSLGHSVGHSLGRIFGHHSDRHGARPEKNPSSRIHNPVHPLPAVFTRRPERRRMFHGNRFFSSDYCDSLRFSWRDFLFPGEFDCFRDGFLADPFFYSERRARHSIRFDRECDQTLAE